jgi:hypothetical protein
MLCIFTPQALPIISSMKHFSLFYSSRILHAVGVTYGHQNMNMQPLTGQKEDGVSFFYRYAVPMAQKRRALERSAYLRRRRYLSVA